MSSASTVPAEVTTGRTVRVVVRNDCGCVVHFDQLFGAGPGVQPFRFGMTMCGKHARYSAMIALADTSRLTVELSNAD